MERFPVLSPALTAKLDVPGPRYTSYPTVPEWGDLGPAAYREALGRMARERPAEPLSLYVHIPFCEERCTYCGCNVAVTRDRGRADGYLDAVAREIGLVARELGDRRTVSRLHLGGGTPTFLDEAQLGRLWRSITGELTIAADAELALEIDPVVTTRAQLDLLAAQGFNRLSMGVQDFDPEVQAAVHRVQSVEETESLMCHARGIGFASLNLDLIYGLPRQTAASWRKTIETVAALRPDRLSIFSFAFVPEVMPHQRRLVVADIPTGAAKLELLRVAHDTLLERGYVAIGMDHFALPDNELAQAHAAGTLWRDFQGYTTRRAPDTVAFGVSGISDLGLAFAQNVKAIRRYEALLAEGTLPVDKGIVLDDDDRRRRAVITDLMCNDVIDLANHGGDFAGELEHLEPLAADGLIELDGARIRLTHTGRIFRRNIAMVFDAYLARRGAERPRFSRTI